MNVIKIIFLCIVLILTSCNSKTEKDIWLNEPNKIKYSKEREKEVWGKVLRGDDAELFYNTSLYLVAKAIMEKNNSQIDELVNKIDSKDINYQEPKFETTIGHLALSNNNVDALIPLINKGLDCNIMDREGSSLIAFINTAFASRHDNSLKVLKLMISHGGNVNLLSKKNNIARTPLIAAAGSNLENVKILINAGADPNFVYKDIPEDQFPESPLISALESQRMDIIEYLIYDLKVDFKTLKYSSKSKYNPNGYKILGYLRSMVFEFDSERYKQKMKLVNYLSEQGLDYWTTEIPRNIRENKNFTKEYLSKY